MCDIDAHNALSLPSLLPFLPAVPPDLSIKLHTSATIPRETLTACFNLVRSNMLPMYQRSEMGWNDQGKRAEMENRDMRYLVFSQQGEGTREGEGERGEGGSNDEERGIDGFLSFMVTKEAGDEVIYCYELQLAVSARNKGHGKTLMRLMEGFGKNAGLAKAMLTVFSENKEAVRFYTQIGYTIDKISPKPRLLRSGVKQEPSYYIFSKML